MKVNMEKVKAYLEENPQKYAYEDIGGLMDILFWDFIENNPLTNEAIRTNLKNVEQFLQKLAFKEADEVYSHFFQICGEYQRLAFIAGAQTGFRLALELSNLI